MSKIIYNLFFYTILGGFLIISALINLIHGYYPEDLIGYVLFAPAAVLILFMAFTLKAHRIKLKKMNTSFLPFLLFVSWIFLTSLLGRTLQAGFGQLTTYMILFLIVPYLLGLALSDKICHINRRLPSVIFLILLVSGLISTITNWHEIIYGRYRVTGFATIGANTFALTLGAYAVLVLNNLFISNLKTSYKFLGGAALIILVASVAFFSGSMGNIISLCLTTLLLMYINKGYRKYIIGVTLLLICVGSMLIVSFNPDINQNSFSGKENFGKFRERIDFLKEKDFSRVGGMRFFYINQYLQKFRDNPVMGSGFGSRDGLRCDPHSWFIELLGETGFISLLFFALIIYYPLRSSYYIIKYQSNQPELFLLATLFFANFFAAFFSGSIFINHIFWFLVGIIPFYAKGTFTNNWRVQI